MWFTGFKGAEWKISKFANYFMTKLRTDSSSNHFMAHCFAILRSAGKVLTDFISFIHSLKYPSCENLGCKDGRKQGSILGAPNWDKKNQVYLIHLLSWGFKMESKEVWLIPLRFLGRQDGIKSQLYLIQLPLNFDGLRWDKKPFVITIGFEQWAYWHTTHQD